MSSTLTRGPLPPRVYGRRRLVLLAVLVGLVFLGLRGLTGGDPAPDAVARQSAGTPTAGPTADAKAGDLASPTPSDDPSRGTSQARKKKQGTPSPTPTPTPTPTALPDPTGPCADEDVVVTPVVAEAVGGSPVPIVLNLRTRTADACTWKASPNHLTLKITSGADDVWSSRQCPRAVPTKDVVVRRDTTTSVTVTWNARRSDDGCPGGQSYALAGYYHVDVAALGGEPADVQFELVEPSSTQRIPPGQATAKSGDTGRTGKSGKTGKTGKAGGTGKAGTTGRTGTSR